MPLKHKFHSSLKICAFLAVFLSYSNISNSSEEPSESWYQSSLIHAHTRFSTFHAKRFNNEEWLSTYLNLGTIFPSLGFPNYTRHLKSRGEEPYLFSAAAKEREEHLFEALSNSRNGNVIWYYWINSNNEQESRHPEWICKSKQGLIQAHKNSGTHLDLASKYRDIYEHDIKKILAGPAKGIYFDWRHYPPTGCYSTALEAEFIKRYPNTEESQYDRLFEVFKGEKLSTIFAGLNRLKSTPDQELIISSTSIPTLINPEMRFSQLQAGVPKNEFFNTEKVGLNLRFNSRGKRKVFSKAYRSARLSLGLDLLADISGKKPHIWIHRPSSAADLEAIVATTLTHNAIANIDFSEKWLIDINQGRTNKYIQEIQAVAKNVAHLEASIRSSRKKPTVRLIISEQERDSYTDLGKYFEQVIMPITEIYQILLHSGISIAITDDSDLQRPDLNETWLILPNDRNTESEHKITYSEFLKRPNIILEKLKKLQDINISTNTEKSELHVRYHDNGSYSIIHLNDYSWVTTESYKSRFITPKPETFESTINIDLSNLPACNRELIYKDIKTPLPIDKSTISLELETFYDIITISSCL